MTMEPAPLAPANPEAIPTRRSNRVLDIALALAAVMAIGGVAFAAGRITAPAPAGGPAFARGLAPGGGTIVTPDGSFDPNGPRQGGVGQNGGLTIDGEVTAVDADSITLKLADGQEMTFKLEDTTTYHEAADASSSEVTVGDDVSVKVTGGRVVTSNGSETPDLSASDVAVSR